MFALLSVITANGVTSEPVPEVVGIQINLAFLPNSGNLKARFLISMNFCLISSKLTSGCSYINHITLAASIEEPPPNAIITSGSKFLINSTPFSTVSILGSGSTSKNNSKSTLFLLLLITSSIFST